MGEQDDQLNADKISLEIKKLELEKRLLERQLSPRGTLLSWLQAASVPVALLGATLAFFVGYGQLNQGAESHAGDLLDKDLTRLSSAQPMEQMTGVAGLRLFVEGSDAPLQREALDFLVNQLSVEDNVEVRDAILNILYDLRGTNVSQDTLNEVLRTVVERDRALTANLVSTMGKSEAERDVQILSKFKIAGFDPKDVTDHIPLRFLASLNAAQFLMLIAAEHDPFHEQATADELPLYSLSLAIKPLLARGAIASDYNSIFCEGCDFTAAKSLKGADFHNAFLMGAIFWHASLSGASFRNADLDGANFFGADLSGADLSNDDPQIHQASFDEDEVFLPPSLDCSNLAGADLSGLPLMSVEMDYDTTSNSSLAYILKMPFLLFARTDDKTRLDDIGVTTIVSVTDDYLTHHQNIPLGQDFPPNPLTGFVSVFAKDYSGYGLRNGFFYRLLSDKLTTEPAKWDKTFYITDEDFRAYDLDDLDPYAVVLKGAIAQPILKNLPLYSKFIAAAAALPISDPVAKAAEAAWFEGTTRSFKQVAPSSCDDAARFDFPFSPDPLRIGLRSPFGEPSVPPGPTDGRMNFEASTMTKGEPSTKAR
jgi:uncharacterized protein YjbI with pentapeptide repeats